MNENRSMGSIDAGEVIPPVFTGRFDSNSIILHKSSTSSKFSPSVRLKIEDVLRELGISLEGELIL
jgi:hypothetical protein